VLRRAGVPVLLIKDGRLVRRSPISATAEKEKHEPAAAR